MTKQAEKDYIRRAAGLDWERYKPFSPPDANTIEDSASLIHAFALALQILRPTPDDRLLDLGAGSCWCSEWLQRINLDAVSVDISFDMLSVGRTRFSATRPGRLVTGDLESLPFRSGVFTKAICLNALHHIPDIPAALREIHRVLASDGCVLFSEPGSGHSSKPWSIAAMRDFGVLEGDILPGVLLEACLDAGFLEARLKPISYVIPEFDIDSRQWSAWQRFWRRKRPLRATQKLVRNLLEIAGLGKGGPLLEETLAVNLIRLFKQPVEDHPIVVAYKAKPAEFERQPFAAEIRVTGAPRQCAAGAPVELAVELRNTGSMTWSSLDPPARGYQRVRLGIQLLDAEGLLRDRDYHRHDLQAGVAPGGSALEICRFAAPASPGPHASEIDLVAEGLSWFEPKGTKPAVCAFLVE